MEILKDIIKIVIVAPFIIVIFGFAIIAWFYCCKIIWTVIKGLTLAGVDAIKERLK